MGKSVNITQAVLKRESGYYRKEDLPGLFIKAPALELAGEEVGALKSVANTECVGSNI